MGIPIKLHITFLLILPFLAWSMDGGRVLRAWFAERMSYIRATREAAGIGKMFAIFMGIFGLFYRGNKPEDVDA